MDPVLIPILVVSIPIVAIISNTATKLYRMNLEAKAQGGGGVSAKALQQLLEENRQLKHRIENLEVMVNDGAYLAAAAKPDKEVQQQLSLLTQEIAALKKNKE